MKKFLICLAPALLVYVMVTIMAATSSSGDLMLPFSIGLLTLGAVVSGSFVAAYVYRKVEAEKWAKILVGTLCFLGVTIAYFTVSVAGCCGLALLSETLNR